jgi:hypothetical protein
MIALNRYPKLLLTALVLAMLAGCRAADAPATRLTVASGHTSRVVRGAEVVTLPIYEETAHDLRPEALVIQGVFVRRGQGPAEAATWSVTAAGGGPRGQTLGLVVALPPEASGPLAIEADLQYDGRPQKLVAVLERTSVGRRRVWLVRSAAVDPMPH